MVRYLICLLVCRADGCGGWVAFLAPIRLFNTGLYALWGDGVVHLSGLNIHSRGRSGFATDHRVLASGRWTGNLVLGWWSALATVGVLPVCLSPSKRIGGWLLYWGISTWAWKYRVCLWCMSECTESLLECLGVSMRVHVCKREGTYVSVCMFSHSARLAGPG